MTKKKIEYGKGKDMPHFSRNEWLRQFEGVRVFRGDRNDGIFVFNLNDTYIGLAPFYNMNKVLCWQPKRQKVLLSGQDGKIVERKMYPILTIGMEHGKELSEAILAVSGKTGDVLVEEKEGVKVESPEDRDIQELLKKTGWG